MNLRKKVEDGLAESAFVKLLLMQRQAAVIEEIGVRLTKVLKAGRTVFLFGNGGSAADAQHIAAELEARFLRERRALPCHALTTNTSTLTAIGNDYGYEQIFARQVEGLGVRGDVLLALSTSGRSANVVAALRKARALGLVTIGFTGAKGAAMGADCDHLLIAPTEDTPVVQQIHLAVGHGICDEIEQALMREAAPK